MFYACVVFSGFRQSELIKEKKEGKKKAKEHWKC